jgi:uncharacterized spore protein YtfJ
MIEVIWDTLSPAKSIPEVVEERMGVSCCLSSEVNSILEHVEILGEPIEMKGTVVSPICSIGRYRGVATP